MASWQEPWKTSREERRAAEKRAAEGKKTVQTHDCDPHSTATEPTHGACELRGVFLCRQWLTTRLKCSCYGGAATLGGGLHHTLATFYGAPAVVKRALKLSFSFVTLSICSLRILFSSVMSCNCVAADFNCCSNTFSFSRSAGVTSKPRTFSGTAASAGAALPMFSLPAPTKTKS
uniref:Uncharacterized protein n=1 Tax=Noctiluca scintillans TaxID=2966 RepID=A0A7S1FFU0_NOCSC